MTETTREMTKRKPIQVPNNFVLCEDGTMWKWAPATTSLDILIPPHWEKLPDIPSDEEYEKQREEREELWEKRNEKLSKMQEEQEIEIRKLLSAENGVKGLNPL